MGKKGVLYKGIFWIKSDAEDNEMILSKIPVDPNGNIIDSDIVLNLNSKHGDNYNHKLTWGSFASKITDGKPFDYYPRGRVEIKRGRAVIYANPNICNPEFMKKIAEEFCLNEQHGIMKIKIVPDYSEHYRCYLDRED